MVASIWYPNAVIWRPSIGEAMQDIFDMKSCVLYLADWITTNSNAIDHVGVVYSKLKMNPYAQARFKYRTGDVIRW